MTSGQQFLLKSSACFSGGNVQFLDLMLSKTVGMASESSGF